MEIVNNFDEQRRPAGGHAKGVGIDIRWQNGPLGRDEDRIAPNGAFVEHVMEIAKARLEHYQDSPFECEENQIAIDHLRDALRALNGRTARREKAGVEGTHSGN